MPWLKYDFSGNYGLFVRYQAGNQVQTQWKFPEKKWHPFKTDIQLNDNCFIKILQHFLLFNFQIKVYKYSMSKNSWAQTNNEDLDQMLLLKSKIW